MKKQYPRKVCELHCEIRAVHYLDHFLTVFVLCMLTLFEIYNDNLQLRIILKETVNIEK